MQQQSSEIRGATPQLNESSINEVNIISLSYWDESFNGTEKLKKSEKEIISPKGQPL